VAVESLHDPQTAQSLAQPQTLSYDDLPPGSDLRRQYGEDGSVAITAPAGEPSDAARRAALHSTGVFAALFAAGLMGILGASFILDRPPRIDPPLRVLAAVLFAVVCGGFFLLAWRAGFTTRLDLLAKARRQTTLLHASPVRLLIETSGPDGDQSIDIPAEKIRWIRPTPEGLLGGVSREPVPCLKLTTLDGSVYRLLRGRHRGELTWVANTLRAALGRPIPMPSDKEGPQSR
jgi:hypothetical protein